MLPFPVGRTDIHKKDFFIPPEAQMRHSAIFGKSGTGKSTLMRNMMVWDIHNDVGLTGLDPHADLISDVLDNIPKRRAGDVIYLNLLDPERAIGINPLQRVSEAQKPLVVSRIIKMLQNIWSAFWGPQTEFILSNLVAALLDQKQPTTFLALLKMLTDEDYRDFIAAKSSDPVVKLSLQMYSEQWGDRFRTEASAPLLNKIGKLVGNPLARAVLGQNTSSFNFRAMMDSKKILLCELPKGTLGDDVSSLIGSTVVSMLSLAALTRADTPERHRVPHKLYADEVQNFIKAVDLPTILAEARKYKLALTIATQTIDQLPEESRASVFGNCGTIISFRVSSEDAKLIADDFADPTITAAQLQNLPDYRAYVKTLIKLNKESSALIPSNSLVNSHPPMVARKSYRDAIVKTSRERYGRLKTQIEKQHEKFLERRSPTPDNAR